MTEAHRLEKEHSKIEWDATKHRHPNWPEDMYLIREKNDPGYGRLALVLQDGRDDKLYKELVNDTST